MKSLNNLSSNLLSIGQKLLINKYDNTDSSEYGTYIVKSGDTLWSIASKYNTTVDNIKDINNLSSNLLSVGQKLLVPNILTYAVKSGDTLYSIAQLYGTTVSNLMSLNNLSSSNLSIGQILEIS